MGLVAPAFAGSNIIAGTAPEYRGEKLKEANMADCEMNFVKTAEIVRRAYMQASGVVADEDRQSLPIPVAKNGEPWIVFLFSPSLARPKEPTKISPPSYSIRLSANSGKLKELLSVTPKDFKQKHDIGGMIGEISMPANLSFEEFTLKRNRLYELYDELLPVFFADCDIDGPRLRALVKEFNQLFELLSEPPLLPYYLAAGDKFFDWIAQNER